MIIDVEGGTLSECMRILRHEAGHVLQHSYQLQRRRRWQELFGLSSKRYPRYYRPNPASRHFVQHLRLWYAQSHPDEDFAETFAVWLRPRSNWRTRYAGWPALKKLEYVDELMTEIAGQRPLLTGRERGRSAQQTHRDAWRTLQKEAVALRLRCAHDLRPRSAAVVLRRSEATTGRRRPRRSSGAIVRESESWSRSGRASTSSRSMPCSTISSPGVASSICVRSDPSVN